jgi:hypothetical protein
MPPTSMTTESAAIAPTTPSTEAITPGRSQPALVAALRLAPASLASASRTARS